MITFNKNSWHYKLIELTNKIPYWEKYDDKINFCTYLTHFIVAVSTVVVWVFGGFLFILPIGKFIGETAGMVSFGNWSFLMYSNLAVIGFAELVSVAVIGGITFLAYVDLSKYKKNVCKHKI